MGSTSESLTLEEVVEINRRQIDMFGGLFLPANNLHNGDSLAFALEAVDAVSFGRELYPTLHEKVAFLIYSIIQNHIFHDGNKRTAMTVGRVYLLMYGYDLEIEKDVVDQDAMNVAIDVADSKKSRDDLAEWIREWMSPLED